MDVQKIVLDEVYYYQFKLPDYLFKIIKDEVEEIAEKKFSSAVPYNYSLAGAIEHEYVMFKSAEAVKDFFSHQKFNYHGKCLQLAYVPDKEGTGLLPSLWVNYQKKHEYNPIHNHDGTISFVIWVKIPYDLKDERNMPHIQTNRAPLLPAFTFLYSPIFTRQGTPVETHRIEVDSSYEGMCIVFPSKLQHMVTPFYTSDDFRISVSGNFNLV